MLNLVVDIGNTFSKIALFDNRVLLRLDAVKNLSVDDLDPYFQQYDIEHAIVSAVGHEQAGIELYLKSKCNFHQFKVSTVKGIYNLYKTPSTLGTDRFAAVVGAMSRYPGNTLIIDAGTCITYDFIDHACNYYGGAISPGIDMRLKAMSLFTDKLPLVEAEDSFEGYIGNDTKSALLAGVMQAVIYEATGFIESYLQKWPDLRVLLCGGDVKFFERKLKSSIFAQYVQVEPHLVLLGLNEVIYQYNE